MKCTAIVLAAGQGKRMKSKVQKQFLELKGKPVLYYSLACFEKSEEIQEILVVTGEESIEFVKKEIIEIYGFQKVKAVVAGGKDTILYIMAFWPAKIVIMFLFMMEQDLL